MKVITVANEKGGVAKTTTVVNIAAELAARGKKVLVIDLDKQAQATLILHRRLLPGERSMINVIEGVETGVTVGDILVPSHVAGISVAPSGEGMARAEIVLAPMMRRESVLARALATPLIESFDYAIIDTSPSLGLVTINAFMAADHVLIPVQCAPLPAEGLAELLKSTEKMRRGLEARFQIAGVLLTIYDRRKALTAEIEAIIRNRFGELVFQEPVGINARLEEAPAHGKTILEYEGPLGKGARAYAQATDELLARIETHAALAAAAG
jgi:chromosome partitioning protein